MLIAFAVLLIVLVATAQLTSSLFGEAAATQSQVAATDLADQYLSSLAQAPLSTLQGDVNRTVSLGTTALGGERYALSQYLGWYGTGSAPALCVSGNPPEVMQATITVGWGHRHRVAETSVINPPYGAAQSADGWLSIRIESAADANRAPGDVSAVQVVVTPQGGTAMPALAPDAQGCLYEPVPAGSYSVAVTGPSSPLFVNNNNQPTPPAVSAVVTAGQATDVAVQYDQAAAVDFVPQASNPPVASGLPVTVSNPGMTAGSQVVIPAGSPTDGPVNVFPFPSGYSAWFGDCTDEQPTSPSTVTVQPGATATASVSGLVQLNLAVSTPGSSVTGTAKLSDPNCTTETYGLGQAPVTGGAATLSSQVIPESYLLTVTDTSDGKSATLAVSWDSVHQAWQYNVGSTPTESSPATPIAMSVP